MNREIELHIEELVLHGFRSSDGAPIAAAVQRELTRLIAERGLDSFTKGVLRVERMDAGGFPLNADAGPNVKGSQIARRLYQKLSSDAAPSSRTPTPPPRSEGKGHV